jgi:hypothetical protein
MQIGFGILKNGDLGCGLNTSAIITEVPQRLSFTGTGNVSSTSFYSYFQEQSGGTQSFEVWGWMVEETSFPSSYIKTPGQASVTRTAENLSFAWSALPQVMTGQFTGVALSGGLNGSGVRLFQLSSAHDANEPRLLVFWPAGGGSLYHQNTGLGAVQADTANSVVYGDAFEFRSVLRADGSVLAGKTLNGGAETVTAPTGALALSAVWGTAAFSPPRLYIGTTGAPNAGANWAISSIRFVKGEQSLDYMRYDFLNAITSDFAEFVHLLEFQFASGTVRLATGAQDLSWNALQWEAIGGLLEMGGVEETSDARAQGIDVRLSGVDQTVLSVLLNSQYRGRTVKIWRGHLDRTTGQFVGDPLLIFQGLQLSPYTVDEDRSRTAGTVRISTRLSGYFGVERIRGIMTNLASHQHHFSDVDSYKNTPTDAWDQQVYSVQGFFGGAFAQIEAPARPSEVMFGLNSDPQSDANWPGIDYAINLTGDPGHGVAIYESGVGQSFPATTWDVGDIFTIVYDNAAVSYYKNGALLRSVTVGPGLTFFFDSTYYGGLNLSTYGIARLKNIRFGPDLTLFRSTFVASAGVSLTIVPDLFFQHSASLANVKIYWGTPVPRTPGSSSGGDHGRQCFPAGTKIRMADNTEKPIETVQIGDWVAAFDETDGTQSIGRVRGRKEHVAQQLLMVVAGETILCTTPEHRFYAGSGRFVAAGELQTGQSIWSWESLGLEPVEVSLVEPLPRRETVVYNLDVEEFHTYVANGIAVHNIKLEPNDGL